MKTLLARVHRAHNLQDALEFRAAHPEATLLAGGTDIMVFAEAGTIDPSLVLDLWPLDELRGISEDGRRIGALCTWTEIAWHAALPEVLRECAFTVGALQIQNRGTVGGNIANASPAGDSLPLWLAWDAEFEAHSVRGSRRIKATDFWTAYRKTALAPDEILVAVHLPELGPAGLGGDALAYRKVGTRMAQSISKIVLGARARIEGGKVVSAGLAMGSVAATPVRLRSLEAALIGQAPDPALAVHVQADIAPIDDVRSTAQYRRRVAQNVVGGWLETLRAASS